MVSPDRDPLTGIPPSRHPFQIWVLFACALSGLGTVLGLGVPRSLAAAIPHVMIIVWGWIMMIGGVFGMVSAWWRDRITGLLLERIALAAIAGASIIYSTVAWWEVPRLAGQITATYVSIAIAAIWRWIHINRELRMLSRWIERHF